MNSKNLLATITLFTASFVLFGQDATQKKTIKRIKINDFYILSGNIIENSTNGILTDFKSLASQSLLQNNNFSNYSQVEHTKFTDNTMVSLMVGIKFRDKEKTAYKKNPLLRIGINYFNGTSLSGQLNNDITKPYDTLSSSSGQTFFRDSIITKSYDMDYSYEQIRFESSLIFRTNPEDRWSLFAGVGLSIGYSFNATTNIDYINYSRIKTRNLSDNANLAPNTISVNTKTEKYNNRNSFGLAAFVPMGVDFRIGNKREFWKRAHLLFEIRPGLNAISIPELRTIVNSSMLFGFGLKVNID